jgi:carbonic anhydrase/acetyltransferase-like protein (isoleucine patch superfamily)
MAVIRPFSGKTPKLHESVFTTFDAVIVGDVTIGAGSSVWFGSVLRGDVHSIRIGERTNVQDGCIVHVTHGRFGTTVGDEVTLGHRVTLHGCTVKNRCLVGIGAIVMDGAVVGEGSMVGAGALVPPGMEIPPGMLAVGAPARVKRELSSAEKAHLAESAKNYAEYAARYREEGFGRAS